MIASLHHNYLLLARVAAAAFALGLGGLLGGPLRGAPVLPRRHLAAVLHELLEEAPLVLEELEEPAESME